MFSSFVISVYITLFGTSWQKFTLELQQLCIFYASTDVVLKGVLLLVDK